MIQAKCIQKFRDKNNHIYGYKLQDINGQTQDVRPDNLKQAIVNKQIHVVNLTLTSDGRLVDTTEKQLQSKKLGSAPQIQLSKFEKECQSIIAYIAKGAHIYFNNDTYNYESVNKSERVEISSKEFTKIQAKLDLLITNEESHVEDSTRYRIKVVISSSIPYEIVNESHGEKLSMADDTVAFINKFKSSIENINGANDLLKAASFLSYYSGEAPEMMIEVAIKSLENIYGIKTHDEIQRRINVITNNKDEISRIKRLVHESKKELQYKYDINIKDDDIIKIYAYIRTCIYYEALFSDKVSDIISVHILKCEAENELNFEYKIKSR